MRWSLSLLLIVAVSAPLHAQTRLQRAAGLRPPHLPPAPKPPPVTLDPKKNTYPSVGNAGEGAAYLLAFAVAAPFAGPYLLLEDDLKKLGFFPGFPYENHREGYLWSEQSSEGSPNDLNYIGFRFSAEDGNDFHGLNRVGGTLRMDTCTRFGLQVRGNWLHEDDPSGVCEDLYLGSAELLYRFAQSEHVQCYVGLGAQWSEADIRSRNGVNFTYGLDVQPVRPFVFSASFDIGGLGGDTAYDARGSAGIILHRFELFLGYEWRRIGPTDLSEAMAGFRLWF